MSVESEARNVVHPILQVPMRDSHESAGYWSSHLSSQEEPFISKWVLENGRLRVAVERGSRKRPTMWTVDVEPNHFVSILNVQGTMLVAPYGTSPFAIVLPRTFCILRGPSRMQCLLARGSHSRLLVAWPGRITQALSDWFVESGSEEIGPATAWIVPCHSGTRRGDAYDSMIRACQEPASSSAVVLLGNAHLLAVAALSGSESKSFSLSHISVDLPGSVTQLVEAVRQHPEASWSLKDASSFAGYSPFHLSRTFRTIVGYGFPEYVDRCRTELAIRQMVAGQSSIDELALSCGFGSTQALRDSFREYLGLLPSELKTAPSEVMLGD